MEKHTCDIPLSGPHKGTGLTEFKTALTFSVVSQDMACVCVLVVLEIALGWLIY